MTNWVQQRDGDVLEVVAQRTMKIITANATTTLTTSPMSMSDENANSKASVDSRVGIDQRRENVGSLSEVSRVTRHMLLHVIFNVTFR